MSSCCICEKKIGRFEDKRELSAGNECCYHCALLIRRLETSETPDGFSARLEELNKKLEGQTIRPEIKKDIKQIIQNTKINLGFQGMIHNDCFICGSELPPNTTICNKCGYINSNDGDTRSFQQMAEIYNARSEQYLKNPMYEYCVESVMDSTVLGKFDKTEAEKLINKYAIKGWRLHSAFANEVGKNAAIGINATINQTILIFERCIKAEEK
jgi:hypothetical protein